MWIKNKGQAEDEILQNRFTAYIMTAIQRRRKDYVQQMLKNIEIAGLLDEIHADEAFNLEGEALTDLPLMMKIENEELLQGLQQLGERERYVLLNRAVEAKSFEMLSLELGLTYKGVCAIYYRAVQKIKNRMKGGRA